MQRHSHEGPKGPNITIPITVLVQTKNEEVGISACLEALDAFDEVIVVDSNSTDKTVAISKTLGAEIVNFSWDGRYPKKKQWQLDNVPTRNTWILFLDADETPTHHFISSAAALLKSADTQNVVAFDLGLQYAFDGRPLRHGHRVTKRALVKRTHVWFPPVNDLDAPGMGELEGHYQPVAKGRVKAIANAILHDDKDPVRTWFDRHNKYSDWEAHLRTQDTSRRTIGALRSRQGAFFERVPGKPVAFFAFSYIVRAGFLDGKAGLNYALALSFYYWQISLKTRELRRTPTQASR